MKSTLSAFNNSVALDLKYLRLKLKISCLKVCEVLELHDRGLNLCSPENISKHKAPIQYWLILSLYKCLPDFKLNNYEDKLFII